MLAGEPVDATPVRFVSLTEEVSGPVIDVAIDGLVCRSEGSIGEVGGPTAQDAVQPCSYFIQAPLLPGTSSSLIFALTRCTLCLDGLAPRYQRPPLGKWRGPSV